MILILNTVRRGLLPSYSFALQQRLFRTSRTMESSQKPQAHPSTTDQPTTQEALKSKRIANYDYFMNAKSKRRNPSIMREITKKIVDMPPHTITFAVGVPNVNTFPFQEVSVDLKDGSSFKLAGKELEAALQYMPSSGYTPLVAQLQQLQDKTHGPQDWSNSQALLVTCGSSEPMADVVDMVLFEGDTVIIPLPLYPGTADMLRQYKPQYIGLEQDRDGVQPLQLRERLEELVRQEKPLPKIMYINPTACNPTGINLSVERKREIYNIACEYNFLILEDDPYYSLHFMEEDIPSFLSMDVEGRVVRLDSFSKILSSGLRLGYVTGPKHLLRQVELHMQVTTLHTSGLSQVIVSKLLNHWGHQQYLAHIQRVKSFYKERRDIMLAACNKYLQGLAEWNEPMGGMFLWLKVPVLEDTWSLAAQRCLEKCLVVVHGHPFTGELIPPRYNYIRLSFSLASPEQMDQGVKLLSEIIKEMLKDNKLS